MGTLAEWGTVVKVIAHLVSKAVVHEISDPGGTGVSGFGGNWKMKIMKLGSCKV